MKDEIKEILEDVKRHLDYVEATKQASIRDKEMKAMYDYITNLQEENERLKEIVENLTTMTVCGDKKQIKNTPQYKLDIYKSRNEKAIEYVERVCESEKNINPYILHAPTLLNILNGGDEE